MERQEHACRGRLNVCTCSASQTSTCPQLVQLKGQSGFKVMCPYLLVTLGELPKPMEALTHHLRLRPGHQPHQLWNRVAQCLAQCQHKLDTQRAVSLFLFSSPAEWLYHINGPSAPNLGHSWLFLLLHFLCLFVHQILSILIHKYPLNSFPTCIASATALTQTLLTDRSASRELTSGNSFGGARCHLIPYSPDSLPRCAEYVPSWLTHLSRDPPASTIPLILL